MLGAGLEAGALGWAAVRFAHLGHCCSHLLQHLHACTETSKSSACVITGLPCHAWCFNYYVLTGLGPLHHPHGRLLRQSTMMQAAPWASTRTKGVYRKSSRAGYGENGRLSSPTNAQMRRRLRTSASIRLRMSPFCTFSTSSRPWPQRQPSSAARPLASTPLCTCHELQASCCALP